MCGRIRRPKWRHILQRKPYAGAFHLLVLVGVTVGTWATGTGANGPCGYDVTIIQAPACPPFGPQATIGRAMNDLGQIAGYHCQCFCGSDEAFFWDGSTFTTLPRPPGFRAARAYGMNDQGWIVGSMTQANIDLNHAVLWQNGQPIDLGIPPGGNFSEGLAVNSAGQVVGYWGNNITGPIHGFLWENDVMTDLGPSLGTPSSRAYGVNDAGQVVGWMGSSLISDGEAFIWQDGAVNGLGPIPGGFNSTACAINSAGHVVGSGKTPEGGFPTGLPHAFLSDARGMIDLGTLPGTQFSAAADINDTSQVVGRSWHVVGIPNISHGFIWQSGVMKNFDDLIASALGVSVTIAYAINEQGQIVGQANSAQGTVAVLLSPVGASPADINTDGVVNVLDLIELLLCFGQPATPPCDAPDTNQDAVINVLDLINLLLDFGITCRNS